MTGCGITTTTVQEVALQMFPIGAFWVALCKESTSFPLYFYIHSPSSTVFFIQSLTYRSQPVAWQLVNFPFNGLDEPLLFSLFGCRIYKATFLVQVLNLALLLLITRCLRILCGLGTYSGGGDVTSPSMSSPLVVLSVVLVADVVLGVDVAELADPAGNSELFNSITSSKFCSPK